MQSIILLTIVAYFVVVFFISRLASMSGQDEEEQNILRILRNLKRKRGLEDPDKSSKQQSLSFFGGRNSRWYVVAFGMISASISGITVVSVPGMVGSAGFTYMQMVIGFVFGYFVVAYVLLPLYYRLNITSIYSYLGMRFGVLSHKVGASFFLLFKMVAASSRLYIVLMVLQYYLFDSWHVPFSLVAVFFVGVIFVYTFRSGIKALVWTDFFQTFAMITAMVLLLWNVMQHLDMDFKGMYEAVSTSAYSKCFVFDDFFSSANFFKMFFSGIFVVIVMTGLDQDVMQKNLTCKNLKEAKKDMLSYGFCFIPVNLIFLSVGALLLILANKEGLALPVKGDEILPFFAMNYFGGVVSILFIIALLAAAFSSADSALVSLTTSVSIDMLHLDVTEISFRKRFFIHFSICVLFFALIMLFRLVDSSSALDTIYKMVGYLYGPLLGLFTFGIFTHYAVKDRLVPFICIASPVLCYAINAYFSAAFNYKFGYELLLLNGLLTFLGLSLIRKKGSRVVI